MNHRLSSLLSFFLPTALCAFLFLVPFISYAQTPGNNPVSPIESAAQSVIWFLVVNLTGMLLGLGGAILDTSINQFVIGFGNTFLNSGVGVAVNSTWVIIRDFVNLGFIFGLVYIGFKMILGNDTSNARRWLVNLIIAALLVNFSLLMTKVVVDFSNELSSQIAVEGLGVQDGGVTAKIMNIMNITTIFDYFSGKQGGGADALPAKGGWGYIIGTGILFLVTAFVFGAGGILLIIRFAVLNIYMMLSPLMFIGWVLPPLGNWMGRYWNGFLKRAFFAPIYLLFIYFGLQVLVGLRQSVTGFTDMNFGTAFQGGTTGPAAAMTSGTTITFFILTCVFMIAALVAADKLGAEGASQSLKIGKDLRNRAQRFTKQQTLGRGAQLVNRASAATERAYTRADANLNRTAGGRFARRAIAVGTLGLASDSAIRGGLGAGKGMRVAGSKTYEEVQKQKADLQNRRNTENKVVDRENTLSTNLSILQNGTVDERRNARNQIARAVQKMSDDEVGGLIKAGVLDPEIAAHLTDAQVTAIKNSGKYRNDQLDAINAARNDGTFSEVDKVLDDTANSAGQLETAFSDLARTIKGLSNDRIESLGINKLVNGRVAVNLSDAQITHLENSGKYTADQISQIKQARTIALGTIAVNGGLSVPSVGGPNNTTVADVEKFQREQRQALVDDNQRLSQLPAAVFASPQMMSHITPQVLERRIRNGENIPPNELANIGATIQAFITGTLPNGQSITTMGVQPATQTQINDWKKWYDRSAQSAGLNLTFPNPATTQATKAPTTPATAPNNTPNIVVPGTAEYNQINQNLPPRPGPQP